MYCPKCGTENGDSSLRCVKCWRPLQPVEAGYRMISKDGRPEQVSARKPPSVRLRRILSVLLVLGVLISVFLPRLIEKIDPLIIEDLKEKMGQGKAPPMPPSKKEPTTQAIKHGGEGKDTRVVIPSLEAKVESLRFFEGGYKMTEMKKRVYAGQFRSAQTRFIIWELRLVHPQRAKRHHFRIDEVWYRPDGKILARQSLDTYLEKTWLWSYHNNGWGWENPSRWSPGKYRVELYIEGKRIAAGMFTIV